MKLVIILAIIFAAAAIACVLAARQSSEHTFQCKSCSKEFKPDWKKLFLAVHHDNEYEIHCPYCDNKGCVDKSK